MITVDVVGGLKFKQRLELMKLPNAKKRRITGQLARKVRVASRKRLRTQRDLNGRAWAKRQGDSKRKMLRKFSKHLVAKGSAHAATVGFDGATIGKTAREHQEGYSEIMTAGKMHKQYGKPDYDAPATTKQAKSLRVAGYKIRNKSGKGYKKATLKWIKDNLAQGQAGLILRILTDEKPKASWVIKLPARSFLGATKTEINAMVQTIYDQTINATPKGA